MEKAFLRERVWLLQTRAKSGGRDKFIFAEQGVVKQGGKEWAFATTSAETAVCDIAHLTDNHRTRSLETFSFLILS
jgi:hypothetical protein